MSANTSIEWTDVVWNPVTGCSKVSEGCRHCYAESVAHRFWGARDFTDVQCHADRLEQPLHWKKPRRIFVNSMSDLFHEDVPDSFIVEVYAVMVAAYQHIFQVLTKRPDRRRCMFEERSFREWVGMRAARHINAMRGEHSFNATKNLAAWNVYGAQNIHEGVSVDDQATADERIPILFQSLSVVRWVSAEPLLGPMDLDPYLSYVGRVLSHGGLNWIVVGGESGSSARPCDLAWIRSIVEQCKESGVPVFVKQLGSKPFYASGTVGDLVCRAITDRKGGDMAEWPADLRVREWPR